MICIADFLDKCFLIFRMLYNWKDIVLNFFPQSLSCSGSGQIARQDRLFSHADLHLHHTAEFYLFYTCSVVPCFQTLYILFFRCSSLISFCHLVSNYLKTQLTIFLHILMLSSLTLQKRYYILTGHLRIQACLHNIY